MDNIIRRLIENKQSCNVSSSVFDAEKDSDEMYNLYESIRNLVLKAMKSIPSMSEDVEISAEEIETKSDIIEFRCQLYRVSNEKKRPITIREHDKFVSIIEQKIILPYDEEYKYSRKVSLYGRALSIKLIRQN